MSSPSIYDTYRHHEYFYILPIVFQVGLVLVVSPSWLLDDTIVLILGGESQASAGAGCSFSLRRDVGRSFSFYERATR